MCTLLCPTTDGVLDDATNCRGASITTHVSVPLLRTIISSPDANVPVLLTVTPPEAARVTVD